MKTIIVDNGSSYIDDLKSVVKEYTPRIVEFGIIDHEEIGEDDLVILSGGHKYPVLWHDKEYEQELELINNHKGPVVGICLGSQLIAHAFGSHLHKLERRRKGLVTLYSVTENDIVPDESTVSVYESHNWSVPKVKRPLLAIAESKDGVEVFRHIHRPMYGVQFHPEKSEGVQGEVILRKILDKVSSSG